MWNMQLSKEKKYWLLIGKTWFGMGQSWYRERRLRTWEPLRLNAARLNMKFCFAADDSVLAPQNFMYHYDFKRIRASAAFLWPYSAQRTTRVVVSKLSKKHGHHYELRWIGALAAFSLCKRRRRWLAMRFNMKFFFAVMGGNLATQDRKTSREQYKHCPKS